MSYEIPEPARYRRIKGGAEVTVRSCTGPNRLDTVAVRGSRHTTYVRLENFWKKYKADPARIYFQHNTLTPDNVRTTWDNALVIPAVGDEIPLTCGYMGAAVTWTVARVEWLNRWAVLLHMTRPTGEVQA
ncbi:hypothetical protein BDK92_7332 [Micromonospora pisi]|uniref:Uncharacterized protein n=1 Tax=Micromonospora pisi TaxID=589240 RepID=A0A495JV23_9ACTN|nr:hypothetical protein [Micromonospora pisi]RKR92850.1 hypothetical protein BDK92_7332 [Micromonospora pisi]